MIIKDQIGRLFELRTTPKRIVSLVPSQTELLVDLGLEDCIVGVTKFCIHPKHLRKTKTRVGGTKEIHIDRIKALNPDIILCNKEENTKKIVEACEAICPVHVSDIFTMEDTLELMLQYGILFEVESKAKALVRRIGNEWQEFKIYIASKPKLKVAYFIWKTPWMVAGANTFINYLLTCNGYENVFGDKTRYPTVELIDLKAKAVNHVFLSSEPYPFKTKHVKEFQENMGQSIGVHIVDGEMFSWYGSRLQYAFSYFKSLRQRL
ncbi:MAG: ABC transporter substrate-binding protein [Flavobacteriaceae bacterium]|nr:ABC transporter substrate-binding protein [Flavobacteriaceae bacterium]